MPLLQQWRIPGGAGGCASEHSHCYHRFLFIEHVLCATHHAECFTRVGAFFFPSQQPPEAGTIIISIVQVRKLRHGEVRLLPRGVPAELGFELIAWVCWEGRQGSPCSCLE